MDINIILGFGSLLLGLISIFIARNSVKRKIITYSVIANEKLINTNVENEDQLKIVFKEKIINQPNLMLLKFENSGKIPLKKDDFDNNLIIKLSGPNIKLLYATIIERTPNNIELSYEITENEIIINPFLFNINESFTLKLLTDHTPEINILGRIAGIKQISNKNIKSRAMFPIYVLFIFWILLLSVTLFVYFINPFMLSTVREQFQENGLYPIFVQIIIGIGNLAIIMGVPIYLGYLIMKEKLYSKYKVYNK